MRALVQCHWSACLQHLWRLHSDILLHYSENATPLKTISIGQLAQTNTNLGEYIEQLINTPFASVLLLSPRIPYGNRKWRTKCLEDMSSFAAFANCKLQIASSFCTAFELYWNNMRKPTKYRYINVSISFELSEPTFKLILSCLGFEDTKRLLWTSTWTNGSRMKYIAKLPMQSANNVVPPIEWMNR